MPFIPLKPPKNMLEISSFYTCAPKTTIIWCTVTGIWGETQNFLSFYIHVYHKWKSYDIQLLKYKVRQKEIFDFLCHFLSFQPLDSLENQDFNSEKNTWRYYHFTHLHHKWKPYDVWFLRFCHSGPFFALLPPYNAHLLWTQKIKIFKKIGKNTGRYYHFTNINDSHMMSDTECNGQHFLSFWTGFCSFTPLTTQKIKIWKKFKKCLETLSFYKCVL